MRYFVLLANQKISFYAQKNLLRSAKFFYARDLSSTYYKIKYVAEKRRSYIVLYAGEIASKALSMAFQAEKIMDFERDFSKFPIVKITVSFFENMTIDDFLQIELVKKVLINNYIILEEWGKP